jgi:hypothetical protein
LDGGSPEGLAGGDGCPARVGGTAAVSQGGQGGFERRLQRRGVGSCGSPGFSSDSGAPWNGSTAAPPANSAQGKDSQGLAEAWGHVGGG